MKRDATVKIRATRADVVEWQAKASAVGLSLSSWIRLKLLTGTTPEVAPIPLEATKTVLKTVKVSVADLCKRCQRIGAATCIECRKMLGHKEIDNPL